MSNDLDRLRQLAAAEKVTPETTVTGNMYEIRAVLNEAAKPDFADIDGDGDKEEPMKKAVKDKEKVDEMETMLRNAGLGDSVKEATYNAPTSGEFESYLDDDTAVTVNWQAVDDGDIEVAAFDENNEEVDFTQDDENRWIEHVEAELQDYWDGLGDYQYQRGKDDQLGEVSKKTLSRYAKAASSTSHPRSAPNLASKAGFELGQDSDLSSDAGADDDKKSVKRSKYVAKAIDRLANESELHEMETMLRHAGLSEEAISAKLDEWANSPGNQYEDRGAYHEQPEGETVDLSLRRYLDASPMKVKVEESITESSMQEKYAAFKNVYKTSGDR